MADPILVRAAARLLTAAWTGHRARSVLHVLLSYPRPALLAREPDIFDHRHRGDHPFRVGAWSGFSAGPAPGVHQSAMATQMTQTAIPYHFLRGGTSRGPYFRREDLPQDRDQLAEVLMAVIGAGHPLNIDGIGGGNAVTTKVAMLARSASADSDIDYFFAQVAVQERLVDFKPTCGNMLV